MSIKSSFVPISKHVVSRLVCLKNNSTPIVLGPSKCCIVSGLVIAGLNLHSCAVAPLKVGFSLSRPSFVGHAHIIFNSLSSTLPIGLS